MNRTEDLKHLAFRGFLFLLVLVVFCLTGCDAAEFERIRERSRVNETFRLGCMPVGQEKVVVAWNNGQLVCWRYQPAQYGRQVEVERRVVAAADEVL